MQKSATKYRDHPLRRRHGVRGSTTSGPVAIEFGPLRDDWAEFIETIGEYKQVNGVNHPSFSEIFQVMWFLGYRKVAPRAGHIDRLETDGPRTDAVNEDLP